MIFFYPIFFSSKDTRLPMLFVVFVIISLILGISYIIDDLFNNSEVYNWIASNGYRSLMWVFISITIALSILSIYLIRELNKVDRLLREAEKLIKIKRWREEQNKRQY